MELTTFLAWGVPTAIAAVVWAVRQEGRLNAHDRQHAEHDKRHGELREDISYIRERIDSALHGRR